MPGLAGKWTAILDQIETDTKTITELSDDGSRSKVHMWRAKPAFIEGEYEATIVPGSMTSDEGVTSKTTFNNFLIAIDLLYYSNSTDTFKSGIQNALAVAEKVYDKFHLKTISGTVRIARCRIITGEGLLSERNIDAIPVRVEINAQVSITQS